jgi:hypothetical protein
MRVCFRLPGRPPFILGREICFHVPCTLPWHWWREDPLTPVLIDGKEPAWLRDATTLANLQALIPTASRGAAMHLNVAAKAMLEAFKAQLPEGAKVSFMKEKPKAARPRARTR